jgi:hypothetical protein
MYFNLARQVVEVLVARVEGHGKLVLHPPLKAIAVVCESAELVDIMQTCFEYMKINGHEVLREA